MLQEEPINVQIKPFIEWCFLLKSQDAFDRMASKVEDARARWETESSDIQERNKQLLLEFGLNPLEIWYTLHCKCY